MLKRLTSSIAIAVLMMGSVVLLAGPAQAAPGDCTIRKTVKTGFASCDKGTPGFIQVIISCTGQPLNKLGPKVRASGGTSKKSCFNGRKVDYTSYNYYTS